MESSGPPPPLLSEDWVPILSESLQAFMQAAGDQPALATRIAARVSRFLNATCAVGVLEEAGAPQWSAAAFAAAEGDEAVHAKHAGPRHDDSLIRRVLESGRGLLVPSAAADQVGASPQDSSTFEGRATSVAALPLISNGQVFGVILVARFAAGEPLRERDLQLGQHFAERAAIALDHGRALSSAHRELVQRQLLAERLRVLAQASRDFAAASADEQQLLGVVARTVGGILGDLCSIRLVSPDGQWLRNEHAGVFHKDHRVEEAFRQVLLARPQRVGDGFAGRVAESGLPLLQTIPNPDTFVERIHAAYRPLLDTMQVASLLVVPLMSRRRCLGVLSLARGAQSPAYDDDDLRLAEELADRAALAVENALLLADLEQRLGEIKKGEEKFRQLLESAPDAIVIINLGGEIILINAQTEELFGYSRRELLGQPVEMLIPAVYRSRHPNLREGYFRAPRLRHTMAAGLSLFGLRKDGSEFAAEINLSPISTPEGQLVTAVIRDVTERKRLEEARARTLDLEMQNRRVQEASRLKSEFLANMSHELRTPLNAIIGFSALLHAGKVGAISETQTEYLSDILTSSRHLLQLINDVLDLAKVEAGRVDVQPQSVDLARVAAEVKDILRGMAVEKKVEISVAIGDGLDDVVTDPRLLKQVLYNYLSNAIKFTPEHGQIHIGIVATPPNLFALSVRDTGIGIKPNDIKRLFHEFQQLDSGTGKRYPGTGLGLALTKRVVEAQGGSVSVTSEPGVGSVFSATLPRSPRPELAEEKE